MLIPGQQDFSGQSPDDLRALIHRGRASGDIPDFGLDPFDGRPVQRQLSMNRPKLGDPAHFFVTQRTRAKPVLNIFVRQPIGRSL
jgi:hypothetical protein